MPTSNEKNYFLVLLFHVVAFATGEQCTTNGDLRLVDGNTVNEGRVEICLEGEWGTICDDNWGTSNAAVVCRELGLPSARGIGQIHNYTEFNCSGTEERLVICSVDGVTTGICVHEEYYAGVRCLNERVCIETDVRLVDRRTSFDGRIEICLNGTWGSVCDDRWDFRDAQVVCRQLQFDGPSYPLLSYKITNGSSTLFHLDDVHCNGTEELLSECEHRGIGLHNCNLGHEEAGVVCTNVTCENGTMHLVGGDDVSRGRVEYCYQGTWYSVCADSWSRTGQEAQVVCSTVGYTGGSVLVNYGRGSSPILPLSINCKSGDSGLNDCITSSLNISLCEHVAGVDCGASCTGGGISDCNECNGSAALSCYAISYESGTICTCTNNCYEFGVCCADVDILENVCFVSECNTGDVRLVGGVTNSTGRLEVCGNSMWGKVCNQLGYWGPDNAKVICRQLGYSDEGAYIVDDDLSSAFEVNERVYVVGEVHCMGTEQEWLDCSHSNIGTHRCAFIPPPDILISCHEATSCKEGQVRLQNGFDTSNGRVEYCRHRTWGQVCGESWNKNDAKVLCSQLGYDPSDAQAIEGFPSAVNSIYFLQNVNCSGSEEDISLCPSTQPTETCQTFAGVTCGQSTYIGRCRDSDRTIPSSTSFGKCEVYISNVEKCENLRIGIDYIYSVNKLGTQSYISSVLNENLRRFINLTLTHDAICVHKVMALLCYYYLPPCGNATNPQSPSSICSEECSYVQQQHCSSTWQVAALMFSNLGQNLECDDTSRLLYPLPNCCTGVGFLTTANTATSTSTVASGKPTDDDGSEQVAGGIIGGLTLVILLITGIIIFLLLLVFLRRQRKRKILERMTQDIMAFNPGRAGEEAAVVLQNIQFGNHGRKEGKIHFDNSTTFSTSSAIYNPYSSTVGANNVSPSMHRSRLSSAHVRELAHGNFVVKYEDINLLESIGEGEFGIVYKAKLSQKRGTSREVAVKTIKGDFDLNDMDCFVEESLKMSRFKHAHVMGLTGVCMDTGSTPFIIMPYMANGSLLKYLKKERETLVIHEETNVDEDEVLEVRKRLLAMCSQVASGMEYLASEKYIHRDLAARNCMIDSHFLIKITDFGLSEDIYLKNYFRQGRDEVKLPVKWMAPESLSDGHFSEKSDVWSYGVTMWEIFSGGKSPYPGINPLNLMQSLERGERLPKPYNSACSDEIFVIMKQCWETSPKDRPSFRELYSNISKYASCMAGYLEMQFNPFNGGVMNKTKDEMEGPMVQVTPPSLPPDVPRFTD